MRLSEVYILFNFFHSVLVLPHVFLFFLFVGAFFSPLEYQLWNDLLVVFGLGTNYGMGTFYSKHN